MKKVLSFLIIIISLFLFSCGHSKHYSSCDDMGKSLLYTHYDDLVKEWGEPYQTNEYNLKYYIKWKGVGFNSTDAELVFTADFLTTIEYPSQFLGVECDGSTTTNSNNTPNSNYVPDNSIKADPQIDSTNSTSQSVVNDSKPTSSLSVSNALMAYYPFTGEVNEFNGNEKNYGATLTKDRFGNQGAYLFNNNYIEVFNKPILNPTNQLSITVWIKLNQYADNQNFVSKSNIDASDPYISYSFKMGDPAINTRAQFNVCLNGKLNTVATKQIIPLNTWIFLVGTYSGNKLQIYINGILDNSINASGTVTNFNTNLNFGRWSAGVPNQPQYLLGSLDDIRLYNRAITQAEITDLATH